MRAVAAPGPAYWDEVAEPLRTESPRTLWRSHSDAVNVALLDRWLPRVRTTRALKTDLFDEALTEGLYPRLAASAESVFGVDLSESVVRAARSRHPSLEAVHADVRRLPFRAGEFGLVVSNSTLDHFSGRDDLIAGVRELHRVLAAGGTLIITLDNPANPVVALRNALPFELLNRIGIVPYYVGATCGRPRLGAILRDAGLEVLSTTAVMHSPRVLAVAAARMVEAHAGPTSGARFMRLLLRFERLEAWPTRYVTGYFVAAKAIKPRTSP
jgi:SAM-dependent methyltransferase